MYGPFRITSVSSVTIERIPDQYFDTAPSFTPDTLAKITGRLTTSSVISKFGRNFNS